MVEGHPGDEFILIPTVYLSAMGTTENITLSITDTRRRRRTENHLGLAETET